MSAEPVDLQEREDDHAYELIAALGILAAFEPRLRNAWLNAVQRIIDRLSRREVQVAVSGQRELVEDFAQRQARAVTAIFKPEADTIIAEVVKDATTASSVSISRLLTVQEHATEIAQQFAAQHLTGVTNQTRLAVRNTVTYAIQNGHTVGTLSQSLRAEVGLNQRQQAAVTNFRYAMIRAGKLPRNVALGRAAQYAQTLRFQRAEMIAQTEVAYALNAGRQAFWEQAVRQGIVPPSARKRWETAMDERTCPVCEPMHGVTVDLMGTFEVDGPGGKQQLSYPPAHPRCRCVPVLIE